MALHVSLAHAGIFLIISVGSPVYLIIPCGSIFLIVFPQVCTSVVIMVHTTKPLIKEVAFGFFLILYLGTLPNKLIHYGLCTRLCLDFQCIIWAEVLPALVAI